MTWMSPGAALLSVLIMDAAVETFASGSPVRWWVAAFAATYPIAAALAWTRGAWRVTAWVPGLALLAIVAATAWLPEGTTNGVRLLGLETSRVLALTAAVGVAAAGLAISRLPRVPHPARWVVAALTAYGVLAFVAGAVKGTPFSLLVRGQSLWQTLPALFQGAFIGGLIVLPLGVVASAVGAGLRTPAPGSRARTMRQAAALATVLATVLAALPRVDAIVDDRALATASTVVPPADRKPGTASFERLSAFEDGLSAIEDGLRELPRDRWDTDYVVRQLGADPDQLFRWVRDSTHWIPYRGLLRGAVGVLNDRLGSSLDRAVLLASLLQQAGHTVRLAHGTIAPERAGELLPTLISARPRDWSVSPGEPPSEPILPVQLESQRSALKRMEADLSARVADQTRRLLAILTRPDLRDQRLTAASGALDALGDHWWVQRHVGEWVDMDLLVPGGAPAISAPSEVMDVTDVPTSARHQITVRVIAEQLSSGRLRERPVIHHTLDCAETLGRSIVLDLSPLAWPQQQPPPDSGASATLYETALQQREWAALLTIDRQVVAKAVVRDTGEVDELSPANPFAGLAGWLAGRVSGEPDAVGAPHAEALTAIWLEYEINAPGRHPRSIRRQVFDLIGPTVRARPPAPAIVLSDAQRIARSLSLTMKTEILPVPCRFAPEFVAHLAAEAVLGNREVLRSFLEPDTSADAALPADLGPRAAPTPTSLYSLALVRIENSRHTDLIFSDRPGILTRHVFLAPQGETVAVKEVTDIVANEIGVDPVEGDPYSIRVEQGVLDTNAEALFRLGVSVAGNTSEAYAATRDWIFVQRADESVLSRIPFPADALARMEEDLAAGYVVVAPAETVTVHSAPFVGWWRVDPRSGDVLGIGPRGWGNAEYARQVSWAERASIAFIREYAWCLVGAEMIEPLRAAVMGEAYGGPLHAAKGSWKVCGVMAAISAGLFATLPLFLRFSARALPGLRGGPRPKPACPANPVPRGGGRSSMAKTFDPADTIPDPPNRPDFAETVPSPRPAGPPVQEEFADAERALEAANKEVDAAIEDFFKYRQKRDFHNDPSWDPQVDELLMNRWEQAAAEWNNAYARLKRLNEEFLGWKCLERVQTPGASKIVVGGASVEKGLKL